MSQFFVIIIKFSIFWYLFTLKIGKTKNHLSTVISSAFNHWLYEFWKVLFVLLIKFNDHTCVNKVYFDLLLFGSDQFSHLKFFFAILKINLLYSLFCQSLSFDSVLSNIPNIFKKIPDFCEKVIRLLWCRNDNVTSMTVSMNKIIFDKHFKKNLRT